MTRSTQLYAVSVSMVFVACVVAGAGAWIGPVSLVPLVVFASVGSLIMGKADTERAREHQLTPGPRAAYLPDAEREVDAMGLNGPALREIERPTTDADQLKANALAPVPPKPVGYVMAGRVFPAPEDPGWYAASDSFFHGGARGIHVYSGSTLHSVDIACVNVAKGKEAMLYAKAIKAAQKARALATLPLAPSEKETA